MRTGAVGGILGALAVRSVAFRLERGIGWAGIGRNFASTSAPTPPVNADTALMEAITRNWVTKWVHHNGLCPWSAQTLVGNRLRVVAITEDPLVPEGLAVVENKFIDECKLLISEHRDNNSPANSSPETTLLVLPKLTNFMDFLDVEEHLEGLLEEYDLDPDIQIASFHPEYQFDGTSPEDVENFTNRSPYPLLHLLRVEQVSSAIKNAKFSTDDVWKRNIELMKSMGCEKVMKIQQEIIETATKGTP